MIPKKVEKMSLEQQEAFLLQKLMDLQKKEQVFRRALAKVRGKVKIDVSDWERMDLIELKGGD
jgi:predicted DNA binding CopG/RHH family protein